MVPRVNSELLLVGSLPADSADSALRAAAAFYDGLVFALPDGETGPRSAWVGYERERLVRPNPDVVVVQETESPTGIPRHAYETPVFGIRPGATGLRWDSWPRIDDAIAGYEVFRTLRADGVIPAGLRFQVGLPFPSSALSGFKADIAADYPVAARAYEDLVARELTRLTAAIPPDELAIQWDLAYETQDLEGVLAWMPEGAWERFAGPVTRLTRLIPAEVLVGLPTVLLSVRVVLLSLAAGRPRLLYRPGPGRRPCGGSAPGGRMTRRLVVGDLRVQRLDRRNGLRSWTIVWPEGTVHEEADRFLRVHDGSGTQRTYAYYLVDHLRWLDRECLPLEGVRLRDLERYMGVVGADVMMPLGEPWRQGRRPYGRAALSTAAACLKGFYLHQASLGINTELGGALDRTRLPTRADRRRALLGHVKTEMPANPLAPKGRYRRHPKMLPDGARESMTEAVDSARDRLIVSWLADGGLRIGELCGLHLVDLHLRQNAACGECRHPHLHVCHRPGNPNGAEAKTKHPWKTEGGTVTGGLVKRVSPAMVHAYFEYMTSEYPRGAGHGMLLVQLRGPAAGQPLAPVGARRMLARAGNRAGLGAVKPHSFRHSFTSAVLDASGGNLVIARDAGGWASAAMVNEVYGHVDVHDPAFDAALRAVWGEGR